SNGAMMAYRLACQLSDKIAAIAPVSGQRVFDDCRPKRPVAVLHIHGTADPCALYNGGKACGGCFSQIFGFHLPGDTWACAPVPDAVRAEAQINGCAMKTRVVFAKGAVTCVRYEGCPANAPVELCSIKGEGHRWPGATDTGPPACKTHPDRRICSRYAEIVGPASGDIDGSAFIWDFFRHYHLP
ncbi:MAG: hypothetical protein KGQ70_09540, partial [Alphaproteobacteria bacterium]|nr:hypothetical protein [Alphaproteobacteria bacterium]